MEALPLNCQFKELSNTLISFTNGVTYAYVFGWRGTVPFSSSASFSRNTLSKGYSLKKEIIIPKHFIDGWMSQISVTLDSKT